MTKKEPTFAPYEAWPSDVVVWPAGKPFPVNIANGEARFEIETTGYGWNHIRRISGLAVEFTGTTAKDRPANSGARVWGVRSLQDARESGYQHEGRVSVGGKTRRAFTSSHLFMVEGKLVSVAILYVCKPKSVAG